MKPEERARVLIDDLLLAAGWHICDMAQANIHAAPGVALREFPLNTGHGVADYPTIAMASDGVFKQATEVSTGTAQMTVPLSGLRSIAIGLPPKEEQVRIVTEVDRQLSIIRKVESEVDANLKRAQALHQSTLSKQYVAI